MNVIKYALSKLTGLAYRQEYLCLSKEQFSDPLFAYLVLDGIVVKDITTDHLFVGYKPLIIALPSYPEIEPDRYKKIIVGFNTSLLKIGSKVPGNSFLATLTLHLISSHPPDKTIVHYCLGQYGRHRFLPVFNQWSFQLNNYLFNRRKTNVFLGNNLYKQVQIAYAVPRVISLITLSDDNLFNLFPTDLHGQIHSDYYIISLRHEGKACSQVEKVKQILISTIHAQAYREVYSLGKNHMKDLKPKEHFIFSTKLSDKLQLPLPLQAIEYRELEMISSYTCSIHKLLLFRILHTKKIGPAENTLSHIHSSYATWRLKQGITGNYLMR